MSLPKFIRDIAPSSIVTALAVFSRTRGVLAPPHNLRRKIQTETRASAGPECLFKMTKGTTSMPAALRRRREYAGPTLFSYGFRPFFLSGAYGLRSGSCCGCRSISASCRCLRHSPRSIGTSTRCSTAMCRRSSPASCSPPFLIGPGGCRSTAIRWPASARCG